MDLDIVIRNGTVATATDTFRADIGISGETIVALAANLPKGRTEIDATGRLVLPGGVDSHCHVAQLSGMGIMCADDFYSGTVSAAFGGTTTIIPFAAQHRGLELRKVVSDYHALAGPKAVIDYAFHLIVSDLTPAAMETLPSLIADGYSSFKVYLTYDKLKLDDYQFLEILSLAREHGALVMVHAENNEMIKFLSDKIIALGQTVPLFHAIAHASLAESEATHRAVSLAELIDVPLLIVHVSDPGATDTIRNAQTRGLKIYGETCPQYLFLTSDDIEKPGFEGAKFCCSPPPRNAAGQDAIWRGIANGTFQVVSSDHAPYKFDTSGKLPHGDKTTFKEIANGVPGLELRLPLLFSEGVLKGRITLNEFVAVTATNHAKMYGLHPRKGTIAIGADADIAIWDTTKKTRISWDLLHDNVGYTPYEGRDITGWPVEVLSRGRRVISSGQLMVEGGSGKFLPCGKPDSAKPAGRTIPELQRLNRFLCEPVD